ncbi:HlyC/CorC family transporter [Oerskovia turbata]|uniref:HlyC/CorC family transporter n=1 Tax=Oerskovia turbata TaxID=1713 RepID=A0A4V1N5R8_9CELL|nr:hemolysin family protein [Oerskovia turbata]RXR26143.1 HlyC/CorC family transporter [Oerskovia turbata]RXR36645.1 HlyC/CorC family transporter [Oerskovia turbata]
MTEVPVALLLVLAVVAVVLAGALGAGEAAVMRVTRAAVGEVAAEVEGAASGAHGGGAAGPLPPRVARVRRVQALTEDPPRTAASLAFVRVVAEMLAAACVTLLVLAWLDDWWQALLAALLFSVLVALGFARVAPRALGRQHPVRVLVALSGVLKPAVALTGWLVRASASRDEADGPYERELRDMVDRVNESEIIEEEEREMIRSVFELGDTLTREVMVPRTDMITTPASTPLSKALALFLRSGFSRLPVTGTSVDDLVGVVYFKDVVKVVHASPDAASRRVEDVARPAIFVPESKPVDDLLREMQASASHIAMVVDEYGGVAGLVTIEDALEEIVGELTDEHDRTGPEVEDLGDGTFRVPARLPLDELGELFGRDIEDDDVDTVGGLLSKALGKVPLPGSTAEAQGVHMTGERVEGRRKQLSTVLVCAAVADREDRDEPAASSSTEMSERTDPRERGHRDHQKPPERAERAGRTSDTPRRAGESNEREAHR